MENPPPSAEANRTISPPPAYCRTSKDEWDFFGENSNHHLSDSVSYQTGSDNDGNGIGTAITSDTRFYSGVPSNPYQFKPVNNNRNNDEIPLDTRDKQSRLKCLFRVDTALQQRYNAIDVQLGVFSLVFQFIYYTAATLALCLSGVSIKLYQDPWKQSQVIGGATLTYCLGGLIVACVAVCLYHVG